VGEEGGRRRRRKREEACMVLVEACTALRWYDDDRPRAARQATGCERKRTRRERKKEDKKG
jgi:hypothetical protein